MSKFASTERFFVTPDQGRVVWSAVKSLWLIGMTTIGVIGGGSHPFWNGLISHGTSRRLIIWSRASV